jgi:hypothetical protein
VTADRPDDLLRRAARRVVPDPFFMAGALDAYRALEGLDEPALAQRLGCPPDALVHLALCRRPDPTTPRFRADVERIAAHVGANPLALVRLLRAVSASDALRGVIAETTSSYGLLAAARDHEHEEEAAAEDANGEADGKRRDG